MRRVPQKAVLRTEYPFRTVEACFFTPSAQKMRRVPQKPILRTEYLFGTREGGFRYRISLLYQKSLFFTPSAPENAFGTPGACSAHGAHIPYHRRPSPVPNEPNAEKARGRSLFLYSSNGKSTRMPGKRSLPQTALPEIQQTPKRGLFLYSSIGKFPTNAREKVSSPDSTTGNPTNTKKRPLPIQQYRQIPRSCATVAAGKYLFRRRCSCAQI